MNKLSQLICTIDRKLSQFVAYRFVCDVLTSTTYWEQDTSGKWHRRRFSQEFLDEQERYRAARHMARKLNKKHGGKYGEDDWHI